MTSRLVGWLEILVDMQGSDLLLVPDAPVCMLVEGSVRRMEASLLTGKDIEDAVLPALNPHALELYSKDQIADSSFRIEGLGRFRINLHREKGEAAAAIRALTDEQLATAMPVSLYGDAPLTCQFVLEDHAVRHSYHHLSRIRKALR